MNREAMPKVKVLFVAEELETNGATTSLLSLLRALPKDRYDVSLFLFCHDGPLQGRLPQDVTLLPECPAYAAYRRPMRLAVRAALRQGRVDLALFRLGVWLERGLGLKRRLWKALPSLHGDWDVVCGYTDGVVAQIAVHKVSGGRKCCWIHCPYDRWDQGEQVYAALRRADCCVPVSADTGNSLVRIIGPVRRHVVHNVVDLSDCRARAAADSDRALPRTDGVFRIVSVGRVTPQKGFDIISPAAEALAASGIAFEWLVLGDGDKLAELKARAAPGVRFLGRVANPMPWVNSADVVVCPSRFEAWGLTVSEALCLGKAVVASDLPVFAEQIENGRNGLLVPFDAPRLADAIASLLRDPERRRSLGLAAASYPFTRDRVVGEFDALVRELGVSHG